MRPVRIQGLFGVAGAARRSIPGTRSKSARISVPPTARARGPRRTMPESNTKIRPTTGCSSPPDRQGLKEHSAARKPADEPSRPTCKVCLQVERTFASEMGAPTLPEGVCGSPDFPCASRFSPASQLYRQVATMASAEHFRMLFAVFFRSREDRPRAAACPSRHKRLHLESPPLDHARSRTAASESWVVAGAVS